MSSSLPLYNSKMSTQVLDKQECLVQISDDNDAEEEIMESGPFEPQGNVRIATGLVKKSPKDDNATVIRFPKVPKSRSNFISLQSWEGFVVEKKDKTFVARVSDLTHDNPEEEAEIPLKEVSEGDMGLLEQGAVFYWHIGYLHEASGQIKRHSSIIFRRFPMWRKEDIEKARLEAQKMMELFVRE
ncbi:MAG: hypothetical protein HQK96_20745 [Nitrospirae bacterium]|nr:hypothetical protein [Nitrospirota bacterium]